MIHWWGIFLFLVCVQHSTADLIGAWSLGSVQDSSQHGNDLSLTQTGTGVSFSSINAPLGSSFATFASTTFTLRRASFDPQESGFFTLEFWVLTTDCCAEIFNYDNTSMSLYLGSTDDRRYGILTLAGVKTYGPEEKLIGSEVSDGSWHHVAIVRKLGTVEWHVDAVLYGQVSTGVTTAISSGGCLSVASPACVMSDTDRFLQGSLAELRFWNEARTSTQIRESMHSIAAAAISSGNCAAGFTLRENSELSTDAFSSEPILWLDAQDSSMVNTTSAGRVNRWQDKSLSTNDVIQEDTAIQPLFQSDGFGSGLDSILFDPDESTPATLASYTGSYKGLYSSTFPGSQVRSTTYARVAMTHAVLLTQHMHGESRT